MKAAAEGTGEGLKQQPFTRSGYFSSSQKRRCDGEKETKSLFPGMEERRKKKKAFGSFQLLVIEREMWHEEVPWCWVGLRLNIHGQQRIPKQAKPSMHRRDVIQSLWCSEKRCCSLPKWSKISKIWDLNGQHQLMKIISGFSLTENCGQCYKRFFVGISDSRNSDKI